MACIALSVSFIIGQKWVHLSCLVLVATLNRESSILIPMVFGATYIDKLPIKKFSVVLLSLCSLYFFVRWNMAVFTHGNPVPYDGPMAFVFEQDWRVNNNIIWLLQRGNILTFFSTFGWLPLSYLVFKAFIPIHMKRFHIVVLVYFSMLMFIGNLYEPRILGDIVILLYIPLVLALYAYIEKGTIKPPNQTLLNGRNVISSSLFLELADKYIVFTICLLVFCVIIVINKLGVPYFYG